VIKPLDFFAILAENDLKGDFCAFCQGAAKAVPGLGAKKGRPKF